MVYIVMYNINGSVGIGGVFQRRTHAELCIWDNGYTEKDGSYYKLKNNTDCVAWIEEHPIREEYITWKDM